jgi:hypothetical protein
VLGGFGGQEVHPFTVQTGGPWAVRAPVGMPRV